MALALSIWKPTPGKLLAYAQFLDPTPLPTKGCNVEPLFTKVTMYKRSTGVSCEPFILIESEPHRIIAPWLPPLRPYPSSLERPPKEDADPLTDPPEDAPAAADDGDDHPPPDVAAASTAPLTPSPEVLASGTRRIILSESQEIILHQHLDVMGYEQPLNGARSAIWNRLRAMTPVDLRRTKRQRTGPGPSTWY
jgi:hypothetical protein